MYNRRGELLEEFGNEAETFSGMIARFDKMARARISGYSRTKVVAEFNTSKASYYGWLDEFDLR